MCVYFIFSVTMDSPQCSGPDYHQPTPAQRPHKCVGTGRRCEMKTQCLFPLPAHLNHERDTFKHLMGTKIAPKYTDNTNLEKCQMGAKKKGSKVQINDLGL